jgi:hypothetical protein
VTDFLSEKRKEIDARLRELRPLVEEYQQLEQAANALNGLNGGGTTTSRRRGPGRPRTAGRRRRGRPRGSGKRAIQAMELVSANPGITISELANKMGIKANYLYRVMPTLQKEGKVKKRGRGWHPA